MPFSTGGDASCDARCDFGAGGDALDEGAVVHQIRDRTEGDPTCISGGFDQAVILGDLGEFVTGPLQGLA